MNGAAARRADLGAATSTKTYQLGEQAVHALRDVSFDVMPGEFVAIMGPSGSGKSTLMNMIGALDTPTSGELAIDGVEISQLDADELAELRNRTIGFVFQQFNLLRAHHGARQREAAAAVFAPPAAGHGEPRRARSARAGGPGRPHGPPALAAVRRPAAARGDRARAGEFAAA